MEIEVPLEMRQKYLERRQNDLAACLNALNTKDSKVFETVGHQLKGNAMTFGFEPLAEIGADLETAAQNKDWHLIQALTDRMKSYISERAAHPLV